MTTVNRELLGSVIDATISGNAEAARESLSQYMGQRVAAMIAEAKSKPEDDTEEDTNDDKSDDKSSEPAKKDDEDDNNEEDEEGERQSLTRIIPNDYARWAGVIKSQIGADQFTPENMRDPEFREQFNEVAFDVLDNDPKLDAQSGDVEKLRGQIVTKLWSACRAK